MVEDRIIDEALDWLTNNQAPNGSFPEVGKVSHRDMQGGAAKGLALTAYTLITFLENQVRYNYQHYYRTSEINAKLRRKYLKIQRDNTCTSARRNCNFKMKI